MGMGRMRRLLLVTLPAALPEILVGCRTGLVLALVTMVTSEMIARQAGVGDVLFNALDMGVYEAVYGTILIIAALGCLLDIAFEALRRRLVGWADSRDPLLVGSA
jgi:NitT/TauT family transport system permease protein